MKAALEEKEEATLQLQREMESLQQTVTVVRDESKEKITHAVEKLKAMKSQLVQKQEECTGLEASKSDLSSKVQSLEAEYHQVQSMLEDSQKTWELERAAKVQEYVDLEQKHHELQQQLEGTDEVREEDDGYKKR